MENWWKFFVIIMTLLAVGIVVGLASGQYGLSSISIGMFIVGAVVALVVFKVSYRHSFSNAPLLVAKLRIWKNWSKPTLALFTEKDAIGIEKGLDKIQISVDPNAKVVLLTVGTGKFYDYANPNPVIIIVPSEEIKTKWREKFNEAEKIIQDRQKKREEERKKIKEDLVPKPDKIPEIIH